MVQINSLFRQQSTYSKESTEVDELEASRELLAEHDPEDREN